MILVNSTIVQVQGAHPSITRHVVEVLFAAKYVG
jgi:hypothetical protein